MFKLDLSKIGIGSNSSKMRQGAFTGTGPSTAPVQDRLLVSLNSENFTERKKAALELLAGPKLTDDQTNALMFVMNHDDIAGVRVIAAECLARNGFATGYAVPVLTELVESDTAWSDAIRALQNVGIANKEVIRVLCRALSDPRKRVAAAAALGSFGSAARTALPALEGIAQYCAPGTRAQVRLAIGLIRGTITPALGEESRRMIRNQVVAMADNDGSR